MAEEIPGAHGVKRPPSEDKDSDGRKKVRKLTYSELRKHPVAVRVGAGDDTEIFNCFATLLTTTSTHFHAKLAKFKLTPSSPQLSEKLVLDLPRERPEDFARFQEWMDKNRLWTTSAELNGLKPYDLARLYCFAVRIDAKALQNCCMDSLYKKTQVIAMRISNNAGAGMNTNPDCFVSWYRAARWLASSTEGRQEQLALYLYFVDFFAYFVLQVLLKPENVTLAGLPDSFLWQTLRAINFVLQRHVPGAPHLSNAGSHVANLATRTQTTTTADGKTRTTIAIDDDPTELLPPPPHLTPAPETDTATTAAGHTTENTRLSSTNKDDLITTILVQSAVLRVFKKKQRHTIASTPDDDNEEADVEGRQRKKAKPAFFGVENLCAYHVHTTAHTAAACARSFRASTGGNEVWTLMSNLKS